MAIVAPTSYDAATKSRFERTAEWFLENLHQSQLHNTLCIDLKLEWHDELTEDLSKLGESLAGREDVIAIIGPFGNDTVAEFAPACQKTHKTVIAPTATSDDVIRRFAVGTAGVSNKEPFLWSLTESDITFCEVMMSLYAAYIRRLDYEQDKIIPAALFTPKDSYGRTFFAFSNLTQENLDELGEKGADILQYYQGFSPYADPTTGFEMSYEVKFDAKPTFAECKLYDALMLAAFSASYMEHTRCASLNDAIIAVTTPHSEQMGGSAWSAASMEIYLKAMEQGELMDFRGASGDIRFDDGIYTASIHSTYVHWQILDGKITHHNYLSSDGSHRRGSAMAAWNWLVENPEKDFAREAENKDAGIDYPTLTEQYAVLVQGSHGWNNYRHQADVLGVYQMLRRNGFDDGHIILVLDKALGSDPKNPEPGVIRAENGGADLLGGCAIDYHNGDISPADISNILLGVKTDKTPTVLPKDAGQNILLFWSGHGYNRPNNGADALAWRSSDADQCMTTDLLRQTVSQMQQQGHYRKMLILAEPCFSEAVILPLEGIPGVLAISSAGSREQSFADNWSVELGVWRCDRFSRNLVNYLTASPGTTYRDLYLYCAQHTLGSHVHIVNSSNFGNLYTTGPEEFIRR